MANPATRVEIAGAVRGAFGHPIATRGELLAAAVRNGARPEVITVLEQLPSDRPYRQLRDLWPDLPGLPVGA
jgi:uncharacterized membrane protein